VSVEVLKAKQDVEVARSRLEARGASCLGLETTRPTLLQRLLRRAPPRLGDRVKSWDVLRTAEEIERRYPRTARVLDIGAFNSEILAVLHRLQFTRLTGLDLNPDVRQMPFREHIRYEEGNFLHAPFPDGAFDVITAISVIEHGFDAPALLSEMSRLLDHGGSFIASFDYWPEKLDTRDTKFFGMDWLIFSSQEVRALVAQAAEYGLEPLGPLALEAGEPTVKCAGFDYTFGWMALRKR
jgi:SAM-dependent methyltransferase